MDKLNYIFRIFILFSFSTIITSSCFNDSFSVLDNVEIDHNHKSIEELQLNISQTRNICLEHEENEIRLGDIKEMSPILDKISKDLGRSNSKWLKNKSALIHSSEFGTTITAILEIRNLQMFKLLVQVDHSNQVRNVNVIYMEFYEKIGKKEITPQNTFKQLKLIKFDTYVKNKNSSDYDWSTVQDCIDLVNNYDEGSGSGNTNSDPFGNGPGDPGDGADPGDGSGSGTGTNPGSGGGSIGGTASNVGGVTFIVVCGCGPQHLGGRGNPRCSCNWPDKWILLSDWTPIPFSEINNSDNRSSSLWDCIDILLDTGLFSELDLIELRLDNCDGLGSTFDIDLNSGGNLDALFNDETFCSTWGPYEENCLIASTPEEEDINTSEFAEFYFSCPVMFNHVINNPSSCVSVDQIDCYCEAFTEFEATFETHLDKNFIKAITDQTSLSEILGDINCSSSPEYSTVAQKAILTELKKTRSNLSTDLITSNYFSDPNNIYKLSALKKFLDENKNNSDAEKSATIISEIIAKYGMNGPYTETNKASIETLVAVTSGVSNDPDKPTFTEKFTEAYIQLSYQWSSLNPDSDCNEICTAHLFYLAGLMAYTQSEVHIQLDILGLIPGYGEGADLVNGILYTIEGDGTNAAFSFAATIPFIGWTATGGKYCKIVVEVAPDVTKRLRIRKLADGTLDFGDRNYLRKMLNLPVGDTRQAHHLVAWEHRGHALIQKAGKADELPFHMNHPHNGKAIDAWRNQPNHPNYNTQVRESLDNILQSKFPNGLTNINPNKVTIELKKFENYLSNLIDSNPSLHLNDLTFNYTP